MIKALSVVIPIYNAETLIEPAVMRLKKHLDAMALIYEIVLCDDGSSDGSPDVLSSIDKREEKVRCFFHQPNQGLGFTLKRLFQEARYAYIICLDCDLPFSESVISSLFSRIEKADVIIASRYAGLFNRMPFHRWLVSRAYYWFCRALFDVRVKDLGSGSFLLKKKVVEKLSLTANGFDFHVEFYAKAQKKGFVVEEVAARLSGPEQKGTFSVCRHGPAIVAGTLRVLRDCRQNN